MSDYVSGDGTNRPFVGNDGQKSEGAASLGHTPVRSGGAAKLPKGLYFQVKGIANRVVGKVDRVTYSLKNHKVKRISSDPRDKTGHRFNLGLFNSENRLGGVDWSNYLRGKTVRRG